MKKLLVLSLLMLFVLSFAVMADYNAVKVDSLALGADWPTAEENVVVLDKYETDEASANVWLFYDDDNLYLQFDVYTDYPLNSTKEGHDIWEADSLEFGLALNKFAEEEEKAKWIISKTVNAGYQVVTRNPRTEMQKCEGIDVEIYETDFGFTGQVVFDQSHEIMATFNTTDNEELFVGFQINISKEGDSRDNRVFDVVEDGVNETLRYNTLKLVD